MPPFCLIGDFLTVVYMPSSLAPWRLMDWMLPPCSLFQLQSHHSRPGDQLKLVQEMAKMHQRHSAAGKDWPAKIQEMAGTNAMQIAVVHPGISNKTTVASERNGWEITTAKQSIRCVCTLLHCNGLQLHYGHCKHHTCVIHCHSHTAKTKSYARLILSIPVAQWAVLYVITLHCSIFKSN